MEKQLTFKKEEAEAVYRIVKKYEKKAPENYGEWYDNHHNIYEEPIKNKVIKSVLQKIGKCLPEKRKDEIERKFLNKKYRMFNNKIDTNVYAILEKAFAQLKTVEIKYFDMENVEFSKRKCDIYFTSMRYIIGYCHLRKDVLKFRTSRIAAAQLTEDSYKVQDNFNKNSY